MYIDALYFVTSYYCNIIEVNHFHTLPMSLLSQKVIRTEYGQSGFFYATQLQFLCLNNCKKDMIIKHMPIFLFILFYILVPYITILCYTVTDCINFLCLREMVPISSISTT